MVLGQGFPLHHGGREGRKFGGELSDVVVLAGQLKSNNQPKSNFLGGQTQTLINEEV